jgi:hypothetical protein
MPIARDGRFLVFRDLWKLPFLGLESDLLEACLDEVRSRPYKGVFGTPSFGFREDALDCLTRLPDLEAIWFWDVALRSVDAVYALSRLRFFGVHPKRPEIDFSRLPNLESLVWIHKAKDKGVDALTELEHLSVWRFAPTSKSFADLRLPERLSELQILWANPSTLDGLAPIPNLRRLTIARCRNLRSLDGILELFPALEHLVVEACGRVSDSEYKAVVAQMRSLNHASGGWEAPCLEVRLGQGGTQSRLVR